MDIGSGCLMCRKSWLDNPIARGMSARLMGCSLECRESLILRAIGIAVWEWLAEKINSLFILLLLFIFFLIIELKIVKK